MSELREISCRCGVYGRRAALAAISKDSIPKEMLRRAPASEISAIRRNPVDTKARTVAEPTATAARTVLDC